MSQNPILWSESRVVVTGGAGFLGSFVVEKLGARGCRDIFVPRSAEYDLRDREAIRRLYRETRPDMVIHLAAVVGGIGANQDNPGRFFYDNAVMGIELIEQAGSSESRSSSPPGRSARIRSSRRSPSTRTTFGTATRKRPMRRMAWQKR